MAELPYTARAPAKHARFAVLYRPAARVGGLRFTGYSGHPSPCALAGSPCAPGLGSGVTALLGEDAPSLRLAGNSRWSVVLRVAAGARTVTIRVQQPKAAAARPKVHLQANDVASISKATQTAGSGTGWQTLTLTFTASVNSGVRLVFENPEPRGDLYAYFDNISVA